MVIVILQYFAILNKLFLLHGLFFEVAKMVVEKIRKYEVHLTLCCIHINNTRIPNLFGKAMFLKVWTAKVH